MDAYENKIRIAKLESLRQEWSRQDETLAEAEGTLLARCTGLVSVPLRRLEAIDAACLAPVSTLTTQSAIRG